MSENRYLKKFLHFNYIRTPDFLQEHTLTPVPLPSLFSSQVWDDHVLTKNPTKKSRTTSSYHLRIHSSPLIATSFPIASTSPYRPVHELDLLLPQAKNLSNKTFGLVSDSTYLKSLDRSDKLHGAMPFRAAPGSTNNSSYASTDSIWSGDQNAFRHDEKICKRNFLHNYVLGYRDPDSSRRIENIVL